MVKGTSGPARERPSVSVVNSRFMHRRRQLPEYGPDATGSGTCSDDIVLSVLTEPTILARLKATLTLARRCRRWSTRHLAAAVMSAAESCRQCQAGSVHADVRERSPELVDLGRWHRTVVAELIGACQPCERRHGGRELEHRGREALSLDMEVSQRPQAA
jgi:hypothetical protein